MFVNMLLLHLLLQFKMLIDSLPFKYRIIVERVNADGSTKVIGDTGFLDDNSRMIVSTLLNLINNDIELKRKLGEIRKEVD